MVVFYDLETKEILHTEQEVISPRLPIGTTEEKKELLERGGKGFVSIPYEFGLEIFDFKICLDENGNFIGLQPM